MTSRLGSLAVLMFFLVMLASNVEAVEGKKESAVENGYALQKVETKTNGNVFEVRFVGSTNPVFVMRELFDPTHRMFIDISGVTFADGLDPQHLVADNSFTSLQTTVVKGVNPALTRFIFTLKDGYKPKVTRQANDLVIDFSPAEKDSAAAKSNGSDNNNIDGSVNGPDSVVNNSSMKGPDSKIKELIEASAQPSTLSGKGSAQKSVKDSFSFAGYKRERISVDFYKIDLHNVFRLFRDISGINLIVDEDVKGTLTLALNDVPWDFALDVILNLTGLEKEEKFNTIVIYPKDKEFDWPQRASDNLSVKEDQNVQQQETLLIEQSANMPKEIMQAKDLMRKARMAEASKDYEKAASLYEQACSLWPKNDALSTRLAALYLVHLGMNAKASYYAQMSLKTAPQKNYRAALYAAIASANMDKEAEAIEYFTRSISGTPPMKEAIASFAAFSESARRYDAALKLYDKYEQYYGETLNTLVAKARIYDNLGNAKKADEQYKAVLTSGFQVQAALRKYIENRLAKGTN